MIALPISLLGLVIEDVAVVAQENHHAPRQASLVKRHGKHLDRLGRPGNVDLVALEQVVVHGVDHHAHDPAAG